MPSDSLRSWGVLVESASFDSLAQLLPEPLDSAVLHDRWLHSPSVRDFELGRIPSDVFALRFVDEWDLRVTAASFIERFSARPKEPYPAAEALVARLRVNHHVSCLSNCNSLHWARFCVFLGWFNSAYSSHLLGAVKPDARASSVFFQQTRSRVW